MTDEPTDKELEAYCESCNKKCLRHFYNLGRQQGVKGSRLAHDVLYDSSEKDAKIASLSQKCDWQGKQMDSFVAKLAEKSDKIADLERQLQDALMRESFNQGKAAEKQQHPKTAPALTCLDSENGCEICEECADRLIAIGRNEKQPCQSEEFKTKVGVAQKLSQGETRELIGQILELYETTHQPRPTKGDEK